MNDKINTLNILSQKEFSSASGAGRCGGKYEKNSRESLHISNMFLNFASSETKNDGQYIDQGITSRAVSGGRQVVDTFSQMVATHRNGAEPNDDLTMLAIRCL